MVYSIIMRVFGINWIVSKVNNLRISSSFFEIIRPRCSPLIGSNLFGVGEWTLILVMPVSGLYIDVDQLESEAIKTHMRMATSESSLLLGAKTLMCSWFV